MLRLGFCHGEVELGLILIIHGAIDNGLVWISHRMLLSHGSAGV